MSRTIKPMPACLALLLTIACASEDSGGDTAAGSGDTAADTMQVTTAADDDADDGNGTTASGTTGGPGSTGGDPSGDSMGADTAADTTGGDTAAESTGATGATVSGTVWRAMNTNPAGGQDAIGDIYLGLLITCDQNAGDVGGTTVLDADLSDAAVGVPYTIEGVPDGTYYVAAFMDDNGNADPLDPTADMGDLAAVMGIGPGCTQVDIVGGAAVMGADITLNLVVPF